MSKILIFGNSGSGKSTLAKKISTQTACAHLDLDTIAWLPTAPTTPPTRMPLTESEQLINDFIGANEDWVVEGCYADLLQILAHKADQAIFLNLAVEDCIANAKNRPWEPHKYKSPEAQQANLAMLIDWIAQYPIREDTFSEQAHLKLYRAFEGEKKLIVENL